MPHDIAMTLARDVDVVALPMLEFSDVLTSEDLVTIVPAARARGGAVIRRRKVDSLVSEVLVDVGNEEVITTLVS
ncbi:MAG: hypothetical protein FD153_194, partial [Rhodospirillaceae bacterium]